MVFNHLVSDICSVWKHEVSRHRSVLYAGYSMHLVIKYQPLCICIYFIIALLVDWKENKGTCWPVVYDCFELTGLNLLWFILVVFVCTEVNSGKCAFCCCKLLKCKRKQWVKLHFIWQCQHLSDWLLSGPTVCPRRIMVGVINYLLCLNNLSLLIEIHFQRDKDRVCNRNDLRKETTK